MKKRDILRNSIGKINDSTFERFDKIDAEADAGNPPIAEKRKKPWLPWVAAAAALALIITPFAIKNSGGFSFLGPNETTEGAGPLATPGESTPEESTPPDSTPEESTPEESTPEESTPSESTPDESTPIPETTPESQITTTPGDGPVNPDGPFAEFTYELSGDGKSYILRSYKGNYDVLVLPTMHDGLYVTSIGADAFKENNYLKEVILPESLTDIGTSAFEKCENLEKVEFPKSLEKIGSRAFFMCISLKSVVLHENLNQIYSLAFCGCRNIELLTFHEDIKLETIGSTAFSGCHSIKSVRIPDSIKYLSTGVFNGCNSLESVEFGENSNITELQANAFSGCSSLKSISLPKSLKTIGKSAFSASGSLMYVYLPEDSLLTNIGDMAFYNCYSLLSFTIPKNVTEIGKSAFSSCYKLVEVINRSSLTINKGIAADAYGYITSNAMDIHNGESKITEIDGYSFFTYEGTNYLLGFNGEDTDLILPESFNGQPYEIYKYAFYEEEELNSITIPDAVTAIGEKAFNGCYKIEEVHIGINSSLSRIDNRAFGGCVGITEFTVPVGLKDIGDYAFNSCTKLSSLTFAEGCVLERIGENAFGSCNMLENIVLPSGLKTIRRGAFASCKQLGAIILPNSLSDIGDNVFLGCPASITVIFNGTVEEWGNVNKGEDWNKGMDNYVLYIGTETPVSVSVEYMLDGGTQDNRNPTAAVINGEIFKLHQPTRFGYAFVGWTWEGQTDPVKDPVNIVVSEGLVFTAHWEESLRNENYNIECYTPEIDGVLDNEYKYSRVVRLRDNGSEYASGEIYFLWDSEALYFYVRINDETPQYPENGLDFDFESLDIMLSLYNYDPKAEFIEAKRADDIGDAQFRIYRTKDMSDCETVVDNGIKYKDGSHGGFGKWVYDHTNWDDPKSGSNYIVHSNDESGFVAEGFIKWSPELKETVKEGLVIGIGLQYNDDINDDGTRDLKIYNENAGHNSMSMSGNRATCGIFVLGSDYIVD